MSSSNSDLSHTVVFGRSKADLALLKAVKAHLGENPDMSFNELCKEALRHFLVATERPAALTLLLDLQQQITELQGQLEAVRSTVADQQMHIRQQQEQNTAELGLRLEQVERHLFPDRFKVEAPLPPPREPDPLIKRMAGLLEDF